MSLIRATDKVINLANGSVAFSKLPQTPSDVFNLVFQHDSQSIVSDNTTYSFGQFGAITPVSTSPDNFRRVSVPFTATCVKATISYLRTGAVPTSETSTFSLYNFTTNTDHILTNTIDHVAGDFLGVYTGFTPFVLNENNSVSLRWLTPNYATNPSTIRHCVNLWFKRILE